MKPLRLFALVLILLPMAFSAQAQSPTASIPDAYLRVENYPLFNNHEAAMYWKKQIRGEAYTMDECSRIVDLCIASYNYLNDEMRSIIATSNTAAQRKKKATDLDVGIPSNMSSFARSFSTRMHKLAYEDQLDVETTNKVVAMLKLKDEYKSLLDQVLH